MSFASVRRTRTKISFAAVPERTTIACAKICVFPAMLQIFFAQATVVRSDTERPYRTTANGTSRTGLDDDAEWGKAMIVQAPYGQPSGRDRDGRCTAFDTARTAAEDCCDRTFRLVFFFAFLCHPGVINNNFESGCCVRDTMESSMFALAFSLLNT